ncbi:hypothetical protein PYW08_009803 [Mythimna loreyi]|uniref:Uncharacterized protein n=1 Tax=Mythimna loreyi TaxID=667449 RepID=A0ACC2Q7R1_9NEOP|nr:hypothetical protein PYW08_009803 [Mythimna loreyi]
MVKWKQRLSQPSAGHTVISAVVPLFEAWLDRPHGVLTFRMTQVLTGHGKFGRFLHRIRAEETSGCRHCEASPEDTVEHTVEVCPAWEEHRRVLVGVIGGGDLSRRALVHAMVRSEEEWQAVASFCEAVMLVKEEADRMRQRQQRPRRSRRRRDPADIRPP